MIRHKELIEITVCNRKPDVLCLSETHVTQDIDDFELSLNNYSLIRTNSTNARTGGVLTYIKNNIKYKTICNNNVLVKGCWFHVLQITGTSNITICNLYRSPNSSISDFCTKFITYCDNLLELRAIKDLIVTGDFNIDVSNNSYYSNKLVRELSYIGLEQKVTSPTRSTVFSDTIIDLVFTNVNVRTKVITTPRISDHNTVLISIENNNFKSSNLDAYYVRNMKDFNKYDFQLKLRSRFYDSNDNLYINNCSDTTNFNYIVNKIISDINDSLDEVAPVEKKYSKFRWNCKPWIDKNIIHKIKLRDRAYCIAKRTKSILDLFNYKKMRNEIVKELNACKRIYFEQQIDQNKTDSKLMWKSLKELIGDKSKSSTKLNCVNFNGDIITDPV